MIIGIDPGLEGCIVVLDRPEKMALFFDMPSYRTSDSNSKRDYDVHSIAGFLKGFVGKVEIAGIELQGARPKQSAQSGLKTGIGFGMLQGVFATLGISYELVTPAAWKQSIMPGSSKEKGASVLVAQRLFPEFHDQFTLAKHHNRADALLIAEYTWRRHNHGGAKVQAG